MAKFGVVSGILILAVLTALAMFLYGQYSGQKIESRRADAQVALRELQQLLQERYAVFGRYTESGGIAPVLPFNTLPRQGDDVRYRLTLEANQTSYVLRAVPSGCQTSDPCGTLTLDQNGATGANSENCWPALNVQ